MATRAAPKRKGRRTTRPYRSVIGKQGNPWGEAARGAWRPPAEISLSEWAESYRILDPRTSAVERFSCAMNPCIGPVLDAVTDEAVRVITIMGCRQSGKTNTAENALGYWIDRAPGPTLWIEAIEKNIKNPKFRARIDSLFQCDGVRDKAPALDDDKAALKIVMPHMIVTMAWAGSQAAQSGDANRYVVLNELGLYREHTSVDAVSVAGESMTHFADESKLIECSTPQDENDLLDLEWKAADQRFYHLPCPHCGHFQVLVGNPKHALCNANVASLRWPQGKLPTEIIDEGLAWFECVACGGRFDDTHRMSMIRGGVWATAAADIAKRTPHGILQPYTRHIGFHISCFVSPWRDWSGAAAAFVKAKRTGDIESLKNVVRFWFAEPWKVKHKAVQPDALRSCISDYRRNTVPDPNLVIGVTAGVDVQLRSVFYAIRAWGPQMRSWLIDWGELMREGHEGAELADVLSPILTREWMGLRLSAGLIDMQYDTTCVFEFCQVAPVKMLPARGANSEAVKRTSIRQISDSGKQARRGESYVQINPWRICEALTVAMRRQEGTPQEWRIPQDAGEDPDYLLQVTNQVLQKSKTSGKLVWGPRTDQTYLGVGDHLFDAEKLAMAAAYHWRFNQIQKAPRKAAGDGGDGRRDTRSWLGRKSGGWIGR